MDVSVVVVTRDRCDELVATLARLERLAAREEMTEVVVVDNGSTDETVREVRHRYPSVELLALPRNAGAAARNAGARHVRTPLVAFSDDDSWWQPGSLARAAELFAGRRGISGSDHPWSRRSGVRRRRPGAAAVEGSALPVESEEFGDQRVEPG